MQRKSIGEYPIDWHVISKAVKVRAGWKCVRCGHEHDPETGYMLTVHHLDMNPANNEWWNLVALCQRCHLHIQGKVVMEQPYMFEHSAWFRPYVAGYYAARLGKPTDYGYVFAHEEELILQGTFGMEE